MPRGQLPKRDPSICLDAHLREVDQLPEVVSSQTLFGNKAPLELEIGSGKGLYLQRASKARAQHNFIGIEIAKMYAAYAASRLAASSANNVIMVAGDALPVLPKLPDASLRSAHIYFPDPWWKKKHKKRRVVNEYTVTQLFRALQDGGTLHFWTDVLEYFESAIEMIAEKVPQFGPPFPEDPDAAESETETETTEPIQYRTHFERRSVWHEIPVYRVCFVKTAS